MEKYNQQLNGVYRAVEGRSAYIVLFENGASKQGVYLMSSTNPTPHRWFDNSGFTERSNYEYEPASPQQAHHLVECNKAKKLLPMEETMKTFKKDVSQYQIY